MPQLCDDVVSFAVTPVAGSCPRSESEAPALTS